MEQHNNRKGPFQKGDKSKDKVSGSYIFAFMIVQIVAGFIGCLLLKVAFADLDTTLGVILLIWGIVFIITPVILLVLKNRNPETDDDAANASGILRNIAAGAAINSIMKDIEKSQQGPDKKSGRCGIFDSELD